jgi:hypothetical protein
MCSPQSTGNSDLHIRITATVAYVYLAFGRGNKAAAWHFAPDFIDFPLSPAVCEVVHILRAAIPCSTLFIHRALYVHLFVKLSHFLP